MTSESPDHRSLALAALLPVALALAGAGCADVSAPSQARAEISGPDGTPVEVITSTRFVQEGQTSPDPTVPDTGGVSVSLISADTLRRTLPATIDRSLTETQRIFVHVSLPDSAASETAEPVDADLRLFVDDESKARSTGDLLQRALQVSYTSFVSG